MLTIIRYIAKEQFFIYMIATTENFDTSEFKTDVYVLLLNKEWIE